MHLNLGPLANAVHGWATNEPAMDAWHDLCSRSFASKGDMPTGGDTEGDVCVDREASPVGLARAENFSGQFPTAEEPIPTASSSNPPAFSKS